MPPALVVPLPSNLAFKELILVDATDPCSWRVVGPSGLESSLSGSGDAQRFFEDMKDAHKVPLELIYISVAQDEAGRHEFLCLGDVPQALKQPGTREVARVLEEEVKHQRDAAGAVMLYARAAAAPGLALSGPSANLADDLCPKRSYFCNYDVVPQLSLGPTQQLILCDEATLTRELPEERIFEHLRLIVNCHENAARVPSDLYRIGACSTGRKPDVICQEVHRWFHEGDMNRINDDIQERIWEALQSGTVAVHCLAGIHRAPCIVACQFLWRHYALRHYNISDDARTIYSCLKAARPDVEPAYQHVLGSYKKHLQSRFA